MVAGTGHDFNNRHSCEDGVFIRMALMKDLTFDDDNTAGYPNAEDGNVKCGPGIVLAEAHYHTGTHGRFIESGWASTVGIIGWSIGGGHGPFGASKGMGVDNVLEAGVVLADGSYVVANYKENTDLYWALRGGGGSTWGVITHLTIRTHLIPDGGLSVAQVMWSGNFCDKSHAKLNNIIYKH